MPALCECASPDPVIRHRFLGMLEPEALHLFDELSELKLLPNIVTFGATVTACEKGGVLHVHRLMCARPASTCTELPNVLMAQRWTAARS